MALVLNYSPAGVYTNAPTLAQAVAWLRQDLFDRTQNIPLTPSGQPGPTRWADDDLTRALDRAVDEYSHISPLIQSVMTATLPQCRWYQLPPGAWWTESVEYPTGEWPIQFVNFEDNQITPSLMPVAACTAAVQGAAGNLNGSYQWAVTYGKSGGETLLGPLTAALSVSNGQAAITIPTGPPGTIFRNLYRGKGGGGAGFVAQILDNTTTSYTDNLPDGQVGTAPPAVDTTANLQQVLLKMSPYLVPQDTTGVITVTYATKHQLSSAGTSIPERHHDVVILGGAAYAMLAYQVPTNDLFEYQDGELRDHISERYVSGQWLAAAERALAHFQDRLEQVKRQRLAGVGAVAQWGDEPIRWQRT